MEDRVYYTPLYRRLATNALEQLFLAIQRTAPVLTNTVRESALHILWHYAFDLPEAWAITSKILVYLAPKLEQAGYRDDWMAYLQRGIDLSRAMQDRTTEAELAYQLGLLYQLRSKFAQARQLLDRSVELFAALANIRGQAKALNRLAYVACLQARYDEATTFVEATLHLPVVDKYIHQFSSFIRGVIAQDQDKLETAKHHFLHSLALCEELGDQRLVAQRLGSLGFVLYEQEEYAAAITHCKQAIEQFAAIDDSVQQAIMRMNLGNIYVLTENFDQAIELYNQAEIVLQDALDERNLTLLYMNQGVAHRKLRNWEKAQQLLQTAAERWQRLGDVKWWVNSLDELGLLYLDQGLTAAAIVELEKADARLLPLQDEPAYRLLRQNINLHLQQAKAGSA